jgi:hypothetical protein
MAFEAQRGCHGAIAGNELLVGDLVATGTSQQGTHSQEVDLSDSQSACGSCRQPLNCGLDPVKITFGAPFEERVDEDASVEDGAGVALFEELAGSPWRRCR